MSNRIPFLFPNHDCIIIIRNIEFDDDAGICLLYFALLVVSLAVTFQYTTVIIGNDWYNRTTHAMVHLQQLYLSLVSSDDDTDKERLMLQCKVAK